MWRTHSGNDSFCEKQNQKSCGRGLKWIEHTIVPSIGQHNEVKKSFKDDGKLQYWLMVFKQYRT